MAEKASESSNSISLNTVDGKIFKVSPTIANQMQTIQSLIKAYDSSRVISLPHVNAFHLSKIIEYLEGKSATTVSAVKEFEAQFMKDLSLKQLKGLLIAVGYLKVNELLELMPKTVAKLIENKSVEFLRKFFGIVNDFTPSEEAKIREEIAWAFDGVDED
ncbi:putative S-phase kinase-associated protein [Lupinus albus]|uniref:SKP1-like protein n=1 Tax=Lupinus albus TaxID=3870 RepID=A0A6A4NG86_LUPAL|nr:putative S-phase kinase-associated protein [Lupinus albus]